MPYRAPIHVHNPKQLSLLYSVGRACQSAYAGIEIRRLRRRHVCQRPLIRQKAIFPTAPLAPLLSEGSRAASGWGEGSVGVVPKVFQPSSRGYEPYESRKTSYTTTTTPYYTVALASRKLCLRFPLLGGRIQAGLWRLHRVFVNNLTPVAIFPAPPPPVCSCLRFLSRVKGLGPFDCGLAFGEGVSQSQIVFLPGLVVCNSRLGGPLP